jgi:flagellar biosynthesis anti-sigma factor FlgM
MKVENQNTQRIAQKGTENTGTVEKYQRQVETGARSEALSGKDRASFSDRALLLARAHAALESTPEMRGERVEQLRKQVASGNYVVPLDALAKCMLSRLKDNAG